MYFEGNIPYYIKVAETLKRRINSNEYAQGSLIPSEKSLATEFGCSVITIRKSLSLLSNERWIIRKRGVGTRVIFNNEDRMPLIITGDFRDWIDSVSGEKYGLDIEILDMNLIPCPKYVCKTLLLKNDSIVWYLKRIRKIKLEIISLYVNYGPSFLYEILMRKDFLRKSCIDIIQRKTNLNLSSVSQTVKASKADFDIAKELDIHFGDPVFLVENVYYDKSIKPLLFTQMYFRGDRYIYSTSHSL